VLKFKNKFGRLRVKFHTAVIKAALDRKKALFISKLRHISGRNSLKCYIWSIALYGGVSWTLRTAGRKYLEVLKCGAVK
jgi:hypothetical protein